MFQVKSPPQALFDPDLVCDPVYLRKPVLADQPAWARLREQSRTHLTAWEENWPPEALAAPAFRRRLKIFDREAKRAAGLSLFVFRRRDRELLGGLTLTNIRYGAARAGVLGYWIGETFIRQGYGRAAIEAFLPHAFENIGLNRIEAACQPGNDGSKRLLEACRFEQEGFARDYLKINGKWRDHLLYAITAGQFRAKRASIRE